MKRLIFLVCLACLSAVFGLTYANEADEATLKQLTESFLKKAVANDVDAMMEYISANYNDSGKDGKAINFDAFKKTAEERAQKKSENSDIISTLGEIKTTIKAAGNDYRVGVEYNVKDYNLKDNKEIERAEKNFFRWAKESGGWKIIRLRKEKK